jgi:hypothetical protein
MDRTCKHGNDRATCPVDEYPCKVYGFKVSPYAMRTRMTGKAPATRPPVENRGIVTDERGLPIRKDGGKVISTKEWSEKPKLRERYGALRRGQSPTGS